MNKKHTRNFFAFALISFLSLSAMKEGGQENEENYTQRAAQAFFFGEASGLSDLINELFNEARKKADWTPLIEATATGNQKEVIKLINEGHDISAKNKHGRTAYDAASPEIKPMLEELLSFSRAQNDQSSYLSLLPPGLILSISDQIKNQEIPKDTDPHLPRVDEVD